MTVQLDLNADLGEGGKYDEKLMSVVTSCNIACGGHAGDENSMKTALVLAKAHNVAVGAHPSFPDRKNFGRARSTLTGEDLEAALRDQISKFKQMAETFDVDIMHIKPHGALYNMAARDANLASSIFNVLKMELPSTKLYGPPNSELERLSIERSVAYIAEGFADRAYEADGSLRDRTKPDALITNPMKQSEQALQMATEQCVSTIDGQLISIPIKTICIHGDTPDAFAAASAVRSALISRGVSICAPG